MDALDPAELAPERDSSDVFHERAVLTDPPATVREDEGAGLRVPLADLPLY
jgi:hypothetical protein